MSVRDDLDRESELILEAIYQLGGEADTSEIKDYTGIEKNGIIRYRRKEHLEPNDLVETQVVDKGDTMTVTEWTLTDEGTEVVGTLMDSVDDPNLAEQVDELRDVVSEMKRRVERFEGRVDHVEERLDEVDDRFETVEEIEALGDTAREMIGEHTQVREENAELRNRIHKMQEVERIMKDIGFVRNDAIGGWENDEAGGFLAGPLLKKLRVLHDEGVIDDLGQERVEGKRFGPFTDEDE
jgi:regulator of replication initiation timing